MLWGYTPYVGGLGASAHLSGFWSTSVHPLVVHYTSLSQVSNPTAMTSTPPVTVVSSGMSSLSLVIMASSLLGLPATLGQHDVALPPPLTSRCSRGVLGFASVPQQQPTSSMPLQAYANYAMGSLQVGFFFRVEPPPFCILYVWCLFWCLLSTFRCHA